MAPYGQILIGPPGSGKSTFTLGMSHFLSSIGRHCVIVNLDPANDRPPYTPTLDIRDFITLEEVMEVDNLGPNGGLIYAMETFEESIDEFVEKLQELVNLSGGNLYVLFDCAGQTELYTNNKHFRDIFERLVKDLDFRLCVVSLVDCVNLMTPTNWVSSLLLTLRGMLMMNLPQVNILSKIDNLHDLIQGDISEKDSLRKSGDLKDETVTGGLPFNLQYYTDVEDLHYLTPYIRLEAGNRPNWGQKHALLTERIADLIDEFGLLSFEVLSIEDKTSMINLLSVIDRSTGYVLGSNELGGDTIWTEAVRQSGLGYLEDIDIQERWIDNKAEWDELEQSKREELENYLHSQGESQLNSTDPDDEWESSLRQWEAQNGSAFK